MRRYGAFEYVCVDRSEQHTTYEVLTGPGAPFTVRLRRRSALQADRRNGAATDDTVARMPTFLRKLSRSNHDR